MARLVGVRIQKTYVTLPPLELLDLIAEKNEGNAASTGREEVVNRIVETCRRAVRHV